MVDPEPALVSSTATDATRDRRVAILVGVGAVAALIVSLVDAPRAGRATMWVVCAAVIVCWLIAAAALVAKTSRLALWSALLALGAALAMALMRVGDRHGLGVDNSDRRLADVVALATIALSVQLVLSLPNGTLKGRSRQLGAGLGYAVALALVLYFVAGSRALPGWPIAVGWLAAIGLSLPALRTRYLEASAKGRQRVQSLAAGATLCVTVLIVVATLHSLVNWPLDVAPALIAATGLIPLSLAASAARAAIHADRALVVVLSTLGTVAIVAGSYLLAVRGFDKAPTTHSARDLLWWAMAAAAFAAIAQSACADDSRASPPASPTVRARRPTRSCARSAVA